MKSFRYRIPVFAVILLLAVSSVRIYDARMGPDAVTIRALITVPLLKMVSMYVVGAALHLLNPKWRPSLQKPGYLYIAASLLLVSLQVYTSIRFINLHTFDHIGLYWLLGAYYEKESLAVLAVTAGYLLGLGISADRRT